MKLTNSRRLTGPSLFLDGPGVALDVEGDIRLEEAVDAWRHAARDVLDRLGWRDSEIHAFPYRGGATLVFSAPEDALYTGCEVNEAAWAAALEGALDPETVERLRRDVEQERNPRRVALAAAAHQRSVRFLADDEQASVGSGVGCRVWPVDALPSPDGVDWDRISDIPVALITGTNGKTTTARMLSCIARAAGLVAGNTSTDGVQINGETVLEGDYTGGEGARALLQNQRVEMAFLENARGGMLRRGLPIDRAEVAYVTNVGTDHMGEYGINSLEELARVKLLVTKAVREAGVMVVNADDPRLSSARGARTVFVSLAGSTGPPAFVRRGGRLGRLDDQGFVPWLEPADVPATLGGAAEHNVGNALGAMAVADALGIARSAIIEGLSGFGTGIDDNPGRANLLDFGGLRVVLDFAHNPEGLDAALAMARRLSDERVLVLLGQAGDRDDDAIRQLARVAAAHRPDRVIVKEMHRHLRGRQEGEVGRLLVDALLASGLESERIDTAGDEMTAVTRALEWGRPGDVLLLLVHAERQPALQLLARLQKQGWRPGETLAD